MPDFEIDHENSGTDELEMVGGTKCAVEYLDGHTGRWFILVFNSQQVDAVVATNVRCGYGDFSGEDLLNYLNRYGESFTEIIEFP